MRSLLASSKLGDIEAVEELLEKGASIHERNKVRKGWDQMMARVNEARICLYAA